MSASRRARRAGPVGAAFLALAATTLLAALTDRNRYWRFEAALSSVASLACALMVWVFRDRAWLLSVVRWPFVLTVVAGGRLHMRTAASRGGVEQLWFGVRLIRKIYEIVRSLLPERLFRSEEA